MIFDSLPTIINTLLGIVILVGLGLIIVGLVRGITALLRKRPSAREWRILLIGFVILIPLFFLRTLLFVFSF